MSEAVGIPGRGQRLLRVVLVAVGSSLVLLASLLVPLPLLEISPGMTFSLADRLTVDGVAGSEIDGDFRFVAVEVREASFAVLVASWFSDIEVVPRSRFIPPGIGTDVYAASQQEVFQAAADVAVGVGLAAAGIAVDFTDVTGGGVLITQVSADGPAAGLLHPGDRVIAAGGVEVVVVEDFRQAVAGVRGDDVVVLRVVRDGEAVDVAVDPQTPEEGAEVTRIGVTFEALPLRLDLPVPFDIDSDDVGGPSASLLTALATYDLVRDDVDLADGRVISGTGEVRSDGSLERIGAVPAKLATAVAEDVDVFVLPLEQEAEAREALAAGQHDLEILAVSSVEEAIEGLRRD